MPQGCLRCRESDDDLLRSSGLVVARLPCAADGCAHIWPLRHVNSYFALSSDEKRELWALVDKVHATLPDVHAPNGYDIAFAAGRELPDDEHFQVTLRPRGTSGQAPFALTTGKERPFGKALFADLEQAARVDIAVAFVFAAALHAGVLARLRDVLTRAGSRVRVITGDYQAVTEPSALRLLLTLQEQTVSRSPEAETGLAGELELRMFETARAGTSFHPKAYLVYGGAAGAPSATYVGSSNLSVTALFAGVEWNARVEDPAAAALALQRFEELFTHPASTPLTHAWVDAYERTRPQRLGASLDVALGEDPPVPLPTPSPIQAAALKELAATREQGNRAGLVVLATGLGKTWLSAFDSTPERGFGSVLFVAHRAEILNQAMNTFVRVRPDAAAGLYTGSEKSFEATLLFASVQTLAQPEHLLRFAKDHFDYIVVDEFHHAAASTYRRVLDHFEPKFMLGLTATPERSDGGDLLALCDENLVFERGLAAGVRSGLLAPFHYFGVPDVVEYSQVPWRGRRFDEEALTSAVATQARAQNALQQLQLLGGQRCLAFCVSQRHADFMRDYFRANSQFRCASVHSGAGSDARSRCLDELATGELDVLFCVDMFNEGLDVPSIDTVLMLRPTESKVIWLQQLGRGLRIHAGKTHLRVIDYIGNHRAFLLKPQALFEALGVSIHSPQHLLRELTQPSYELPAGCEVTYTLEAREILATLCPPSRSTQSFQEWYEAFREQAERRPSAREAVHSRFDPHALRAEFGGWFGFVRAMGDLSMAEEAALRSGQALLGELEALPVASGGSFITLDALRAHAGLPGGADLAELGAAFVRRARRSAALSARLAPDLLEPSRVEAQLRETVLPQLCSRRTSARGANAEPLFQLQGDRFSATTAAGLPSDELSELVAELLEWRIVEFLSLRPTEVVLHVVRSASSEPMLRFDREQYAIPDAWQMVVADATDFRAHYAKQHVDRLESESGDGNQLGDLLRGWFGAEAGLAGAGHRIRQTASADGRWLWRPETPSALTDDEGKALDAHFDLELFEGEPTVVFHSRGAGRNNDYTPGLQLLLRRLGVLGVQLTRIAVESQHTRTLPLDARIVRLAELAYPIALAAQEAAALQRQIGRATAAIGRAPGAKGQGNATKRLRLWLDRAVDVGVLERGRG